MQKRTIPCKKRHLQFGCKMVSLANHATTCISALKNRRIAGASLKSQRNTVANEMQ